MQPIFAAARDGADRRRGGVDLPLRLRVGLRVGDHHPELRLDLVPLEHVEDLVCGWSGAQKPSSSMPCALYWSSSASNVRDVLGAPVVGEPPKPSRSSMPPALRPAVSSRRTGRCTRRRGCRGRRRMPREQKRRPHHGVRPLRRTRLRAAAKRGAPRTAQRQILARESSSRLPPAAFEEREQLPELLLRRRAGRTRRSRTPRRASPSSPAPRRTTRRAPCGTARRSPRLRAAMPPAAPAPLFASRSGATCGIRLSLPLAPPS